MTSITPQLLQQKILAGEEVYLLDVRTPREYAQVHVPGAILEPLETFQAARVKQGISGLPGAALYVLCHSGSRAKRAVARLQEAGVSRCVLVEGGTMAWAQAGLPVERQAIKGISLERQVRIAAGFLVLTGTLLGLWLHPAILGLPIFVGAGLMFAGITDICGMGIMLARMPWNRLDSAGTISHCSPSTSGKT